MSINCAKYSKIKSVEIFTCYNRERALQSIFLYFITPRVLIIFMYESMNKLKSDPELQPCETSENAERGRFIPQADRNPAAAHQGPGCPA